MLLVIAIDRKRIVLQNPGCLSTDGEDRGSIGLRSPQTAVSF